MASVKFYLNRPNSSGLAQLLLYLSIKGKRGFAATDEFVKPGNWNGKKQQVKASAIGASEINEKLKKWESGVLEAYRRQQLDDLHLGVEDIRQLIKNVIYPPQKSSKAPMFTVTSFGEHLAARSVGIKAATASNYIKTVKRLQEFEHQKRKGIPVQFEDVDRDFYNDFVKFLYSDRGNAKNTVGNYVKFLKKFLNEAVNQELTTNTRFRRFETLREDVENIYLNRDELKLLCDLDLEGKNKLDEVRDRFLIGCYTGLRYSDVQRLNKNNIDGNFLRLRTLKTDDQVIIPLHPLMRKIIEKYGFNFPAPISNQKMNDYLKLLGKSAGLTEGFTVSKTMAANKRVSQTKPKYSLITTHTARRSFATNAFLDGIPSLIIMAITGHKTEKSFLKYIKVTKEEHAAKLAELWQKIERQNLQIVSQ